MGALAVDKDALVACSHSEFSLFKAPLEVGTDESKSGRGNFNSHCSCLPGSKFDFFKGAKPLDVRAYGGYKVGGEE